MKDTLPVLIGGCPRSGTTAILQVLNTNPNTFISSEENLLKFIKHLNKLLGTSERRKKTLSKGMRSMSVRETLTPDKIHNHNFRIDAVWPTLRSVYQYHHYQLCSGSLLLWGDKSPLYAEHIEQICMMNEVNYMHVTRNPLDVVNSMLRRTSETKKGRDWWASITEFDAMLDAWVVAYESIMSYEKRNDVFHLYYEEFVFNFDETMDAVNKFLGVDLIYCNLLISDITLHYERSFLTKDMVDKICSHPVVITYFERAIKSKELKNVNYSIMSRS